MVELAAIGPDPLQRWQKPIPDGQTVCLGRSPSDGLSVPWDHRISREHAELSWDGRALQVRCLETARNRIYVDDQPLKEFSVAVGGAFRIGETRFVVCQPSDANVSKQFLEEHSFSRGELKDVVFVDPARQMELIARLPELIRTSRNDEDLAMGLASLLLEALPRADVAAVVRYDGLDGAVSSQPTMMRWNRRNQTADPFVPNRRLIAKALVRRKSLLHIWGSTITSSGTVAQFSGSQFSSVEWGICTPIANEACLGWCLYFSGSSATGITAADLLGDVKFTDLLTQFIGSIRQVRQLENMQAKMSKFFSPVVLETLSAEAANILLLPKESDITVMFCDVHGFSKTTELEAQTLLSLLERVSRALGLMTRGIVKHGGIIADFQGDAAFGFWGWPVALDDGPLPACLAALAIQSEFQRVAASDDLLAGFHVGIGIAHGRAVAGKIGTDQYAKVGVFGPLMDLGADLQGLTRQLNVPILIDETTAQHVRESMPQVQGRCRWLGRMRAVKFEGAVTVHELLPGSESNPDLSGNHIAEFEIAVDAIARGDWSYARERLQRLPDNDAAVEFLTRFLSRHEYRPPANWDGTMAVV
ncbi:MAG TPA: adenylate/guanylate cyclase domain-containing protein [Planctomycetaceae bacterium]